MADKKISDLTTLSSINTGDYIEVSETDGIGGFNSKKYDLGDLASTIANHVVKTRSLTAGTGLSGGGDLSADITFSVDYGTSAGTACEGNDSRLSDSRTPIAHTHTLSNITDAGNIATINTNASTSNYLRGDGTWSTPPGIELSAMSIAEGQTGTATTLRAMRADYLKAIIEHHATEGSVSLAALTAGTGITGSDYDGSTARTWSITFGTASGTVCRGNDSRLSDSRTPTTHSHVANDLPDINNLNGTVLSLSKGANGATIEGINTYSTTAGISAVKGTCGSNGSVGTGYLGGYINGQRAGVIGIAGSYLAGYFDGSIAVTGMVEGLEFNATSDIRKKENITSIQAPLDILDQLTGIEFSWKMSNKKSSGLIAQEVEKILPHLVSTDTQGFKSINYLGLFGYVIEAIKELRKTNA